MADAPSIFRPRVLVSGGVGLALLGASAIFGWPVALGWIGGICLGFAAGAVFGPGRSRSAPAAVQTPTGPVSTITAEFLTDLELRAKVRGDFETAGLVDRLQALFARLRSAEADVASGAPGGDPLAGELVYKLRQMYDFSAHNLERALALYVGAREMATDEGRRKVLDQRAKLVSEVSSAVGQIEAAVDRVRAAATTAGDERRHEKLTDLNRDLDRQIEVARRVEAQIREVESRARGDYSAAERYVTGA